MALAVLEPWTSGLGSVGCMTIWDAKKRRGTVVDFPGIVPRPVQSSDLVWPGSRIAEHDPDAAFGIEAHRSIAVPGQPDGLWTAHSFGSKPWPSLMAPAVDLSQQGLEIDWYAFLVIGVAAADLVRFPGSRAWFLPHGFPASFVRVGANFRIRNDALTASLKSLADRGARDFYEGMVAHELVADLEQGGSSITKSDLRRYRARLLEPQTAHHAGKRFLIPPESPVGRIFAEIIGTADDWRPSVDQATVMNYAHAFSAARAEIDFGHDADATEWSSHVSVIDGDGNMASLSQTLGSVFGAKIVLPETGILANNCAHGLQRQAAGAREEDRKTVSHLLPLIGLSGDRPWLSIGVSGDRHILPTLVQLISFVSDFGFSVEDAFHQPRIGVRGPGEILVDAAVSTEIKRALGEAFRT
ncbi:MAG: gamma-glutamyltransferase, partial [Alphaproteobacteria bacterium]